MNYFSRVSLKPSMNAKRLFIHEQTKDKHNNYRVHQALWKLFDSPQGSRRPFLYREYERRGEIFYYLLSDSQPNQTHAFWQVETKEFEPHFFEGQQLQFELRANPVVTICLENKRGRHDVLIRAKKEALKQNITDKEQIQQCQEEAAINWIQDPTRLQSWGIDTIERVEISTYQQHKIMRSRESKKGSLAVAPIQYSSLDYRGILKIADPTIFYQKMMQGFGHQKAFGCGLMLVRSLL